eukprot:NODE_2718_length_1135_cov_31.124309_g2496_i0.p1 GENE.NODE_2718_length_1135_cov_31.124309_g2496_i0~~NODE_2718_length_1135_cov_31.124309_g2496_i0.p1  ORF type:complete len:315 (+),score=40.23 NODE_2718_length_1135_cov_31.124309_g2496_i0:131-1075(+)
MKSPSSSQTDRTAALVGSLVLNVVLVVLALRAPACSTPPPCVCQFAGVDRNTRASVVAPVTDSVTPIASRNHEHGSRKAALRVAVQEAGKQSIPSTGRCADQRGRLVFIDLGANCGNSYQLFIKTILPPLLKKQTSGPGLEDLRAYLFEFNPQLIHQYLEPLEARDSRVEVIKAAAHVENGTFTAYMDNRKEHQNFPCVAQRGARNPAGASSLLSRMPRAGAPITVSAVDVPAFIEAFCPQDTLHVKMDIEGFEYTLLSELIKRRLHCRVHTFYIEFHTKIPWVIFLDHNTTSAAAAAHAKQKLRQCTNFIEWF